MEKNDKQILEYISKNPSSFSKEIHEGSKLEVGYATVKRIVNRLHESNYVDIEGKGSSYSTSSCPKRRNCKNKTPKYLK